MKKIRSIVAFLVTAALLAAGGAFALASDSQGANMEDEVNGPTNILPMVYWQT